MQKPRIVNGKVILPSLQKPVIVPRNRKMDDDNAISSLKEYEPSTAVVLTHGALSN